MNERAAYWIWLQQAVGAGARVDDLLGAFSTAQALYRSTDLERRLSGVLTAKQLARLEKATLADAEWTTVQRVEAASDGVCAADIVPDPTAASAFFRVISEE